MDDRASMDSDLKGKITHLREILKKYTSVAIAFSGGIDSTVLLDNACEVFPDGRVAAVNVVSCLVAKRSSQLAGEVFSRHFEGRCSYRQIHVDPLSWEGFAENSAERCYVCKKSMYSALLTFTQSEKIEVLLDGTNADDLGAIRPGYQAILELGIKTPLAEAGLKKDEIREYARSVGLTNAETPSNSCLATRLQTDISINRERLENIEAAESVLHELGFDGCRVRITGNHTILEVLENDIERCAQVDIRSNILERFKGIGLVSICLNLKGR